jgi:hypothetical protein
VFTASRKRKQKSDRINRITRYKGLRARSVSPQAKKSCLSRKSCLPNGIFLSHSIGVKKINFGNLPCQSSFITRSAFVRQPDRPGAADRHALGLTAAQVAMVDIIIPWDERIKGTGFCEGFFPDKPRTIGLLIRMIVSHAKHPFAVNTYHRLARTGFQIILVYPDGGSARIDHSEVLDGAGHFTEMATTALFGINFYHHFHCCLLSFVDPRINSKDRVQVSGVSI